MSYLPSGDTELIARQGYGGLGADTVAPGVPWGYKDGKCIDTRTGKAVDMDACTAYAPKPPSTASKFFSGMMSWLSPKAPATTAAPAPQAGMPPWVVPVAVGAGALVLVLALKKK